MKHGFQVELWDREKIASQYPFLKEIALDIKNDAELKTKAHSGIEQAVSSFRC